MQIPKPKFIGYYFYYKKQGHQIHECSSRIENTPNTPRFEGYFYNYQNFGHNAYEYRSQEKPYQTNNAPKKVCSNCHKIGHVNNNCRTQELVPNDEHNKGKGKGDKSNLEEKGGNWKQWNK